MQTFFFSFFFSLPDAIRNFNHPLLFFFFIQTLMISEINKDEKETCTGSNVTVVAHSSAERQTNSGNTFLNREK